MDETADERRPTRQDLIEVEFELYSLMLDERRRSLRHSFDHRVEAHLGGGSDWVSISQKYDAPLDASMALVLGEQLQQHASSIAGAVLSEPAEWKQVIIGGKARRAADYVTGFFDAGSLLDIPIVVSTWTHQQHRHVKISLRNTDESAGHDFLQQMEELARGPANPWRLQLLEARLEGAGIRFESRAPEDLDPGPLWFAEEVNRAITRNVTDAAAQLGALRRAGLGSNRGLLLVGPPGVGKTALCRRAALELHGSVTVVLVSAQVGQWMISKLYEELDDLAPVVVFLEDLDLLVGDREDRSARAGLIDFLTVLDGLMTRHHEVVTVASSNDPDAIDAAAIRAGRFDVVVPIGPPDDATRREIFRHFLEKLDLEGPIDVEPLIPLTSGATGADLREIIRRSYLASGGTGITTESLLGEAEGLWAIRNGQGAPPDGAHQTSDSGRYL